MHACLVIHELASEVHLRHQLQFPARGKVTAREPRKSLDAITRNEAQLPPQAGLEVATFTVAAVLQPSAKR